METKDLKDHIDIRLYGLVTVTVLVGALVLGGCASVSSHSGSHASAFEGSEAKYQLDHLPEDAQFNTEEKAVQRAIQLLSAEDPEIRSIELLTLEEALIKSYELHGYDDPVTMSGLETYTQEARDSLVWRIVMDASWMNVPRSCPPPADDDDYECLPPASPAEIIFDPVDGGGILASFGVPE